jgi:hypothetical protein
MLQILELRLVLFIYLAAKYSFVMSKGTPAFNKFVYFDVISSNSWLKLCSDFLLLNHKIKWGV